jgi:CopG family nickel-responsive transcriptional regulator
MQAQAVDARGVRRELRQEAHAAGLARTRRQYEDPQVRNIEVPMELERISLAIEKDLLSRFDALLERRGLGNRSEAVRDLVRRRLVEEEAAEGDAEVVGTLTLVYDHAQRELSDRLVEAGHHHHARVLSTLHVHLDERLCLEVQALRGTPAELRHFGDHVLALKGVKHGQLVVSSARLWHARGRRAHAHPHSPSHTGGRHSSVGSRSKEKKP